MPAAAFDLGVLGERVQAGICQNCSSRLAPQLQRLPQAEGSEVSGRVSQLGDQRQPSSQAPGLP